MLIHNSLMHRVGVRKGCPQQEADENQATEKLCSLEGGDKTPGRQG